MKQINKTLAFLFLYIPIVHAQLNGDWGTVQAGNWSKPSIWRI